MLEKPLEWRRFERVELEGDVARTAPKPANIQPTSMPPSLLQEFERVLRENERLQLEVSTLRAEAARNSSGTDRYREELESARVELNRLEIGPTDIGAPPSRPQTEMAQTVLSSHAATDSEQTLHDIAQIVAGYIFENPSILNIRLVKDALRARGSEESLVNAARMKEA